MSLIGTCGMDSVSLCCEGFLPPSTGAIGEVVAFLLVGVVKDKGVGASYQWVLVKQGVGAS